MDITQALAETLRAEKAIRKVTLPAMAAAAGISRASVIRKLDGDRETKIAELRGFAQALGTTAPTLMAAAEARLSGATPSSGSVDGESPSEPDLDAPPGYVRDTFEEGVRRSVARKTQTGERPTRKRAGGVS